MIYMGVLNILYGKVDKLLLSFADGSSALRHGLK